MTTQDPPYRLLPSIDKLLKLQQDVPHPLAAAAARRCVGALRARMGEAWPPKGGAEGFFSDESLSAELERARRSLASRVHRRVLNATGILLHTGLGRAPIPEAARFAIQDVSGQAITEVDPGSGKRSRREDACAEHLCALTGTEAALVVNNNAAATLLALDAMARGGEVPISRGELVEIGGGFRMPDVMARAGCQMIEVGATNRTRISDYARVVREATSCLLKVHPSNYRIEGFSETTSLEELVALGKERGIPVLEDLGSGYLLSDALPHDAREPNVQHSVEKGVDLVCFSGDKLLGSCQAGILVGTRAAIGRLASHPLYRALRCSKLALAALEATLLIYRFGEPKEEVPVLRAIFEDERKTEARAHALAERLSEAASSIGYELHCVRSQSYVGSGATPARALPSHAVALRAAKGTEPVDKLATAMRLATPSVWGRLEDEQLLFDLRSLQPGEEEELAQCFERISREL